MAEGASEQVGRKPSGSRLVHLVERLIYARHVLWGIGIASFLEALIIPIPLETILIPLMQARRRQMFLISTIALLACLLAAAVGYAAGYFLFDWLGDWVISAVSSPEQFEQVKTQMENKGFWFVFSVGVIPIPFQIAMLAAGATQYSFVLFMLASCLSRAIRYFGLALLVYWAGNRAQHLFEQHKIIVSGVLLVVVGVVWYLSLFA